MLNIVLFGAPGAGKGTQAAFITEKYNLGHISTGDIIRAEIKAESPTGLRAKSIVEAGGLLSDDIVVQLIESHIEKNRTNYKGFLFDGFPRTVGQCRALTEMMSKLNTEITALISLEVPEEELVARLLKRAEIEGRKDDTPEVIRNRFTEYNAKTLPVIDYYKEADKVISINGTGGIKEITEQIITKIDKVK
jgi:adenylate kinase